jgi:hypothetical protein
MNFEKSFRVIWLWSLFFFILAALTGFIYRYGLFHSLPAELSLNNIRHAHSHLMFFNWVTPVPMIFITGFIVKNRPEIAIRFKKSIYAILIIGCTSYPFFLMYGYRPMFIGSAELPFSVILSGLIMIAWYWYAWMYLKYRRLGEAGLPRIFYDAALLMLVISSLGAWGVAVYQFGNIENLLISTALTHFFLAVFTGGWCVLSALGIIYQIMGIQQVNISESWLIAPIVLGVPLTFPFGMPAGLLTNQLLMTASLGGFLIAIGLSANLYVLFIHIKKYPIWWWKVVLNLLGAKTLMILGGALLPFMFWIGEHGLRVLYLHVLLLGFVSLTYFGAWHTLYPKLNKNGFKILTLSILLLLIILLISSGFIPPDWLPGWHFRALLWISLLPAAAAIWEWVNFRRIDDVE